MKNTSHFKIENKRQLELLYEDFKDDLPVNWNKLLARYNNGIRTFQKNSIGLIDFNDQVLQQSTEIENPYAEDSNVGHKASIKGLEQLKKDKAKPDHRRQRIDDILKVLQKDFNPDQVTLLLKIFDLEFQQNENVTLNEIYALHQ